MKYDLKVREHNILPHVDIEKDIESRENGQFTFTLRINNGNIVDYNVTDYVDVKSKYLVLKRIVWEELSLSHTIREGSGGNALRPDNFQLRNQGRSSTARDS